MRFFKLKALSCSGKGNRVLRKSANEVLQEGAFHNPDELVAKGFICETDAEGKALGKSNATTEAVKGSNDGPGESALAAAAAAAAGESGAGEGEDDDNGADEGEESPIAGKTHKSFKKDKLQEMCADVEIVFEDEDTRAELFEMLENHYGLAND